MKKTEARYDRSAQITMIGFDRHVTGEFGTEMTMADYYPEIRKVLSVSAKALPDSKYISDSNLETGGTLAFSMLYIGEDGGLCCVNHVTEYSQNIPMGDYDSGSANIFVQSVAEAPQCRVLAPRSISLKARVNTRVSADSRVGCDAAVQRADDAPLSGEEKRSIERLFSEVESQRRFFSFVTDSVSLTEEASGDAKPVSCSGELIIKDATVSKDTANVKGWVEMTCLVLTGEGEYKTVKKALPFEKTVSLPGVSENCLAGAFGRVASASVRCDGATMEYDAEYDMDMYFCMEEEAEITEDIYSTLCETKAEKMEMTVPVMMACRNFHCPVSAKAERKSEKGEGEHIIFWETSCGGERVSVSDNKINYSALCNFKVYIASGGDVKIEEVSCPIEYETDCPKATADGEYAFNTALSFANCECRLEDNGVFASCDAYAFLAGYKKNELSMVKRAVVEEKADASQEKGNIRICYPEKGKRIWDIAKERGCSITVTERINKVERKGVSDGTPLIFI